MLLINALSLIDFSFNHYAKHVLSVLNSTFKSYKSEAMTITSSQRLGDHAQNTRD